MSLLMLCIQPIWSKLELNILWDVIKDLQLTFCRVHKMREELCDDTLAYDLEF
jgi:hypothetical protein